MLEENQEPEVFLSGRQARSVHASEEMNCIKLKSFDIEEQRERLRKMTDAQLLEFGRAGRQL